MSGGSTIKAIRFLPERNRDLIAIELETGDVLELTTDHVPRAASSYKFAFKNIRFFYLLI